MNSRQNLKLHMTIQRKEKILPTFEYYTNFSEIQAKLQELTEPNT